MKIALGYLVLFLVSPVWANSDLLGTWKSDCNVFGKHSFKATSTFSKNKKQVIFKLFEDKSCISHSLTVAYDGNFSAGKSFGEGIELNSVPSTVQFTVHLQVVVDQFNDPTSPDGCGLKNWKLNVTQDVSGRYCRPFQMPTVGQEIFDIYAIQGKELRFGGIPLNWNLSDPALRPTKLSSVVFQSVR